MSDEQDRAAIERVASEECRYAMDVIHIHVTDRDVLIRLARECLELRRRLAAANKEIRDIERDARESIREAVAEERWKHSQGDEYGSY